MSQALRLPMPRLSETLAGPRAPDRCQACGDADRLSRWREHDEHDRPERIIVVLCGPCADSIVGPHPRLYAELPPNEPVPGCMPLCVDCTHRDGTRCTHPAAKANGGAGVILTLPRPVVVHLCRVPRRLSGWHTLYPGPAKACAQKESITQEVPDGQALPALFSL